MTTAVYWGHLAALAYAVWRRGWFWTDDTTRGRDVIGFVALTAYAMVISMAVAA